MPIFDNLRGLVPLPTSRKGNRNSDVNTSTKGVSDEIFSPEFPIPLPEVPKIDVSNTFVDNVYTQVNDVFEYIQLPTPEVVSGIYGVTQRIEEVISDPINFVRGAAQGALYDLLHPQDKNMFPKDVRASYPKPVEIAGLDLLTGSEGTPELSAGRAPLPAKDSKSTDRLDSPSSVEGYDEVELVRDFKGRESLEDMTLRSSHLWDLKIEPFEYRGVKNEWVPTVTQNEKNALLNRNSKYAKLFPKVIPKVSDYMPILSYNVDLKTLTTKQLELFGGSSIAVPDLIRYTSQMSIQIVDDENKRWRRWFQNYADNLYESTTNSVAPYKNSCLLITLYQYREDHKVLSHNRYICSLMNYQMISAGTGEVSSDVLDIELSIVGRHELASEYSYLEIV
jgi:hypothetical protein